MWRTDKQTDSGADYVGGVRGMEYRKAYKCKVCNKIYAESLPELCYSCGTEIAHADNFSKFLGLPPMKPLDSLDIIIACRKWWQWKWREKK